MTTTPDILRVAATRVRQGWTRGTYRQGRNVCALGAIGYAAYPGHQVDLSYHHPPYCDARDALLAYLDAIGIPRTIPAWNDVVAEDAEDVAATMEKAAAWVEEHPT